MAFSQDILIRLLYKRLIGGTSFTRDTLSLDEEPFKGRENVLLSNLWIDTIPQENPLKSHTIYPASGAIYPTDTPIVKKWHKLPLKPVTTSPTNKSFYYSEELKNFIYSEYGDGTYQWELWKKDVHGNYNVSIPYGIENWYFDPLHGVITFLGDLPSGIDNDRNPPALTAYQYVGRTGEALGSGSNGTVDGIDNVTIVLDNNSNITLSTKYKQAVYWGQNLNADINLVSGEFSIDHGLNSRRLNVEFYKKSGTEFLPVVAGWETDGVGKIKAEFSPTVRSGDFAVKILASY